MASAGVKRGSVRHGPNRPRTVPHANQLGERIAISRRRGDLVDRQRVGDAVAGEDDHVFERAAGDDGQNRVPFAHPRALHFLQPADALDPAVAGQHDVGILANDVRLRIELGDLFFRADRRAAIVAEFLGDLLQFGLDDFPEPGFRSEDLADRFRLGPLLLQLFEDPIDLQRRDAIQGQLEDRFGLLLIERKGLHQLGGRVLLSRSCCG